MAEVSGLEGARCVGLHDLFESVDPLDHIEAKRICDSCPALAACRAALRDEQTPVGTWAGELVGTEWRRAHAREHGTDKGYYQHRTHKENACGECLEAHRFADWLRRRYGVSA